MKIKKTELDVDFIGGEGALTIAEEKALSDFFKKKKIALRHSTHPPKKKTKNRVKTIV